RLLSVLAAGPSSPGRPPPVPATPPRSGIGGAFLNSPSWGQHIRRTVEKGKSGFSGSPVDGRSRLLFFLSPGGATASSQGRQALGRRWRQPFSTFLQAPEGRPSPTVAPPGLGGPSTSLVPGPCGPDYWLPPLRG